MWRTGEQAIQHQCKFLSAVIPAKIDFVCVSAAYHTRRAMCEDTEMPCHSVCGLVWSECPTQNNMLEESVLHVEDCGVPIMTWHAREQDQIVYQKHCRIKTHFDNGLPAQWHVLCTSFWPDSRREKHLPDLITSKKDYCYYCSQSLQSHQIHWSDQNIHPHNQSILSTLVYLSQDMTLHGHLSKVLITSPLPSCCECAVQTNKHGPCLHT